MNFRRFSHQQHYYTWIIAGFVYSLAAFLGLELATLNGQASPVWPATGIAIGFVYICGYSSAFGIFIAATLVNWATGLTLGPALFIGIGNTLEAIIAVWSIHKMFPTSPKFSHHSRLVIQLLAMLVATGVGASIGTLTLAGFSIIPRDQVWMNWITWWTGDTLGGLFIFPFAFLLYAKQFKPFLLNRADWIKAAFLVAISFVLCRWIFLHENGAAFIFLLFVPLYFSAQWFEFSWTYIYSLALGVVSIYFTYTGQGPFSGNSVNENLIHLQLFLASMVLTSIGLGSLKEDGWRIRARLALVLGWTLAGIGFFTFYTMSIDQEQAHFEYETKESESALIKKFTNHIQTLKAGVSHIEASANINQDNWQKFTYRALVDNELSGILGLGIIFPSSQTDTNQFYAENNIQEKIPDFKIHPVNNISDQDRVPRPEINLIITYIEPLQANLQAKGLNVATERNRYQAGLLARDSGEAVMTGPVQLVQDQVQRYGYLLYYPFYQTGLPHNTTEQRRKAFRGFVYAPVIIERLFKSALESQEEVHLSAYYGTNIDPKNLMFSNSPKVSSARNRIVKRIVLNGQNVTLVWSPSLQIGNASLVASWLGFSGAMCALFLAIMVSGFENIASRAQKIADEKTEELRKNQMMLVASARLSSLGEMASGIAHEINNPLTIIMGKARQIESALKKAENPKDLIQSTEQITRTVYRIARIIKGLQSFARETSNEPFESVRIVDVVQNTVELCKERFSKYDTELKVNLASSEESRFMGREEQISQVLMNLLSNSFDAVQSLPEKWVEVGVSVEKDKILLSVMDAGPGISLDLEERIFHPFFTTKEVGKGTGLGLSISKGIIDHHQGRIYLDRSSKNTRFIIELSKA